MGGKEFVKNAKTMESNATPRKKQSRPKQCKIVRQLEKPSGWEARSLLLKPNRLMHRHKPITRPSVTLHQRKRLFNIIQKCNKALHRSIGKQWHNQYQIRLSKLTKSNLHHCFSSATILKQMQSRTHLLSIWIKLKKIGPCGQSYDW